MSKTLLLELLTEELPPKALKRLSEAFAYIFTDSLQAQGFLSRDTGVSVWATPRRLAVTLTNVAPRSPDKQERVKVLPTAIAFAANGKPTVPLLRKLAALGLAESDIGQLQRGNDGKAEALFFDRTIVGSELAVGAQTALDTVLAQLPIPKVMRYASHSGYFNDVSFVRPAHRLLALYGADVLPLKALGLTADRITQGHRFLADRQTITIDEAGQYEAKLRDEGKVIASFPARRAAIVQLLHEAAGDDKVVAPEALLDEVTSLVEYPVVYRGHFDEAFLEVPQECLILTMQQNQKYFALTDANDKLVASFLLVSNIETADPQAIISGNERVLRARLADARFFYQQDSKVRLEERVDKLQTIIYFKGLGSQRDRVARLCHIAQRMAIHIHADEQQAERIALLAKADLVTDMVGEFPELQGIMGRYYAQNDGETQVVADAIQQHYQPRFAGDALPQTKEALVAAIADKSEAIVGMFAIGNVPTGDKDPFGLRRAAIGILRMLTEKALPVKLSQVLNDAYSAFVAQKMIGPDNVDWQKLNLQQADEMPGLLDFFYDRLRGLLKEQGATAEQIEAVLAQRPDLLATVPQRIAAVQAFSALPEAQALAAANKRIVNILKKLEDVERPPADAQPDPALFNAEAEKALWQIFGNEITPQVNAALASGDFTTALKVLAGASLAIDRFFDEVMVMDKDAAVRANRLALLTSLRATMNQVAEISALAL